ncbi:MAG: MarR family winged helix-turn-helix transcriptional regulator [Desulfobulbia bacterium]
MPASEKQLYALILSIRGNQEHLAALGDQLHQDIPITPAMREVLEHLCSAGPKTAPEIARNKKVSRQHIQQLVDKFASHQLVEFVPNPAHKRSARVRVTKHGAQTFATMRQREQAVLKKLCASLSEDEVRDANRALVKLQSVINLELERNAP